MLSIFKTKDEKLFYALKQDGIAVTEQEIQKARENDPDILYKIGEEYHKKEKYKKSFAWIHKAALQNQADAQAQLGDMYQWGQRLQRNYKQAMDWNMKAASAGNAGSQYNIGYLYYRGYGVSVDRKQAMDWFLRAANNGNTDAMNMIGQLCYDGDGVTKSIPTAIEWHAKAANQGDAEAQYILGLIYKNTVEVKDLQKAVNWYQKAADNGNEDAKEELKGLNEEGYHAKEDEQEEEKTNEEEDATTDITNDQSQSSITTSNNDEHFNTLMESRIDHLEKIFQSKMTLMERNNDALQKELATLRKEKHQQDEEKKQLGDKFTKLKVATEDNINNDLNYDSSDNDDDVDDNSATVNVDALQKELAAFKQKELKQHEENQRLKERLARMEEAMQNNADNDLNYDSSVNESDNEVDTGCDSENSDSEEEEDNKDVENTQQPVPIYPDMDESHIDPNYNSSDNEDPRNDIYYD